MAEELQGQGITPFAADLGDGQSCNEHRGLLVSGGHKRLLQRFRRRMGLGSAAPLRSGIPAELYELGLGSTLSINARAQDAEGAAAFIDYLVADKKRAAQWMAAVPSLFNAPLPFTESDFPVSMDDRVARQLAALSQATDKGKFGYTAWTFWPSKSDVYIQDEMQKVLTGDLTPAEFCS